MRVIFRGKILTLPNCLSACRILMIPVFVLLYLNRDDVRPAIAVLAVSAVTDFLDGFIARRFHLVSDFGKALDPFADKLTQVSVLGCLCVRFPQMLWLVILLCVKELFVACSHLAAIRRTESVSGAEWHGKVTTVVLYGTMLIHLLWPELPLQLSWAFVGLCMALLLLSGTLYGFRYLRRFRAAGTDCTQSEGPPDAPETEA